MGNGHQGALFAAPGLRDDAEAAWRRHAAPLEETHGDELTSEEPAREVTPRGKAIKALHAEGAAVLAGLRDGVAPAGSGAETDAGASAEVDNPLYELTLSAGERALLELTRSLGDGSTEDMTRVFRLPPEDRTAVYGSANAW